MQSYIETEATLCHFENQCNIINTVINTINGYLNILVSYLCKCTTGISV